jgi:hypothetical protein
MAELEVEHYPGESAVRQFLIADKLSALHRQCFNMDACALRSYCCLQNPKFTITESSVRFSVRHPNV